MSWFTDRRKAQPPENGFKILRGIVNSLLADRHADQDRHYRVLELKQSASAEEVRQAYFRLIRKYPPEKDAEKFKTIRAAYDALKHVTHLEDHFPGKMPKNPDAAEKVRQAFQNRQDGYHLESAGLFKEALGMVPKDPWLLFHLAFSQRLGGNYDDAIKTLNRLERRIPACPATQALRAMTLQDLGKTRKALKYFRQAVEMEEPDPVFLQSYLSACDALGAVEDYRKIRHALVQCITWTRDNIRIIVRGLWKMENEAESEASDAPEFLAEYEAFIRKYILFMDKNDVLGIIAELVCAYHYRQQVMLDMEPYQEGCLMIILSAYPDWQDIRCMCLSVLYKRMKDDDRLKRGAWSRLPLACARVLQDPDRAANPKWYRLAELDEKLCILKEKSDLEADIAVIRSDYPHFDSLFPGFLDQVAHDPEGLYERLRSEFVTMSGVYQGKSRFFELYPREDPRNKKLRKKTAGGKKKKK